MFTGIPGKFVQVEDTVRSFKAVVDGEYDHLPEAAFYMVGGIDEAVAKAEKLAARSVAMLFASKIASPISLESGRAGCSGDSRELYRGEGRFCERSAATIRRDEAI